MSRMLWVGIFLVGMVGMARGQVNAFLIYDSSVEPPLTDQCVGGNPIPDGYLVEIYWDADNDGPDADDTPPVVGSGPGECNFNSFLTRGRSFWSSRRVRNRPCVFYEHGAGACAILAAGLDW